MRISCEFHYDSAHKLPYVPEGHKCGRLHGHTYTLTVTVDGPVRPDGFVVDFADIKTAIKPLLDQLDHHYLNDIPGLHNPTVEVQLPWIWDRLDLPNLAELTLQEGKSNAATYTGPA